MTIHDIKAIKTHLLRLKHEMCSSAVSYTKQRRSWGVDVLKDSLEEIAVYEQVLKVTEEIFYD